MISCKDVLKGLAELPNEYADIVLVDPPYNINKDFGLTKDNMSLKDYKYWCGEWVSECERVLKESGTMYVYGFPEILCHIAVDLPFPLECKWLQWHYTNKTIPKLKFWQRSHESILCCWKNENLRVFSVDSVREPYTDLFLQNAAGKTRKSTKGRFSHSNKESIYQANEAGALPRDVIKVGALAGGSGFSERFFYCRTCDNAFPNKVLTEHQEHDIFHHPTQKPYELTKRLLLAAKPQEGGIVVIPFVGSGSECAVANDLGMSYVGWDINPDYVKLATKFLENRSLWNKDA